MYMSIYPTIVVYSKLLDNYIISLDALIKKYDITKLDKFDNPTKYDYLKLMLLMFIPIVYLIAFVNSLI